MASSNINVRVDSELKAQAQELFMNLGFDMSTAINMFLRSAVNYGGIPFELRERKLKPEVLEAIQEGEDILSGKVQAKTYHSALEMISDILSEEDDDEV